MIANEKRVKKMNLIFITIWIILFIFIFIIVFSSGGFKNSSEVENIRQHILKYVNSKEVEVYINDKKIIGNEKKILLEIFVGEDYNYTPIQYFVDGNIKNMQKVEIKLKDKEKEIRLEIYKNFDCFNNEQLFNSKYNICETSEILKINYGGNLKELGIFINDEATEILNKYRKKN